jgi:hypothetical protein
MAIKAARGELSSGSLNAMCKIVNSAIRINMEIPVEYLTIVSRGRAKGIDMGQVPWIEQTLSIAPSVRKPE